MNSRTGTTTKQVSVHVGVRVPMYIRRLKVRTECLPQTLSTYFEAALFRELGLCSWLASQLRNLPISTSQQQAFDPPCHLPNQKQFFKILPIFDNKSENPSIYQLL